MRGVAALSVFSLHAAVMIGPFTGSQAFLAVDLFFLISGVVIDRVYGRRIQAGLTPLQFFLNRYIRFYPLYLIGAVIGIGSALVSLTLGQGVLNLGEFVIATVTAIAMIPSPTSSADSFVVPFNYAAWSLIFELFINVVFVSVYRWLKVWVLILIALLSGTAFCIASVALNTVSMGAEWPTFWGGVPRVVFSFTIGVLISRMHTCKPIGTRWAYALSLLPIVFFLPMGGVIVDLAKVLIIFPILVAVALTIEPSFYNVSAKPAVLLGMISYPLYAIHVPVIQLVERACTVLNIDRAAYAPFNGLLLMMALCCVSLVLFRKDDHLQKRISLWRQAKQQQSNAATGL